MQSTASTTKTFADKKDAKPKNNESKSKDKVKKEGAGSDDSGSESAEYEVDYIEGHRLSKDNESIEFFVRWKDYSFQDNTWEAFEFFAQDAPELAQKYLGKVFTAYKIQRNVKDFAAFAKENEKSLTNGGILSLGARKNKETGGHTTGHEELSTDTKIRIISQL